MLILANLPALGPLPFYNRINRCYFTLMLSTACRHLCHSWHEMEAFRMGGFMLLLEETIFGFKQRVQHLLIKIHACHVLGEL